MQKRKRTVALLTLVIFCGGILTLFSSENRVKAEGENLIPFRILSTSDMHGKVTNYNYETLQKDNTAGLNKVATLITNARQETNAANSILVDAGDFLYDYSTNYFYDNKREEVQPILQAMKSLNYDFITMGNHEFDYPWSYLKSQLVNSSFMEKTIVCNMVYNDSGEQVFAPSTIITKTLIANNGVQYNVKIGIVAATRPTVSLVRGDYVNLIDGQSAYNGIKNEAVKLKEQGADVVLAITHGGIGGSAVTASSENIGYALSQIAEIDAIVTGHKHEYFPSADSVYNALPNVNKNTGTMNGKPVVASGSYATGLGVIDLTLSADANGKVSVVGGKSAVRVVSASTGTNAVITNQFAPYYNQLKSAVSTKKYSIAKNIVYTNQFADIEDSDLMQLLNNAKMEFAAAYIKENLPNYKSLPVIASTRNLMHNGEHYVTIKDNITESKLAQVESETSKTTANGYIGLYVITGKQLREWLEYSASVYAKPGTKLINKFPYLKGKKGISTLLSQSYIYDKSRLYQFDGISYQIDIRKAAKYSASGKVVNSKNKRITKLTYNGKAISNSQKFILSSDASFKSYFFMPEVGDSLIALKDRFTSKQVVFDYIKNLSKLGKISVKADDNWKLVAPKNYQFAISGARNYASIARKQTWYKAVMGNTVTRNFYHGIYKAPTQTVNVLLSKGLSIKTNKKVPIYVTANSSASIKSTKWLYGSVTSVKDKKWTKAKTVYHAMFYAEKSGTYSVLVTDKNKKQKITRIKITNINTNIIQVPTVDTVTNRRKVVTGTAEAYATVYVQAAGITYSGVANGSGNYSVSIEPQSGFSTISVWATHQGKQSETVSVWVRHTGANIPNVNQPTLGTSYTKGSDSITGKTDKYNTIHLLMQNKIYVGRGQKAIYLASEYYNPQYEIVETNLKMDENGYFEMDVPRTRVGVNIYVYAVDRLNRSSISVLKTVQ